MQRRRGKRRVGLDDPRRYMSLTIWKLIYTYYCRRLFPSSLSGRLVSSYWIVRKKSQPLREKTESDVEIDYNSFLICDDCKHNTIRYEQGRPLYVWLS